MGETEVPTTIPTKPAWQSKTLWVNFGMAAMALFAPAGVQQWMADNQTALPILFAGINMLLRAVTKTGVQLS